MMVNNSTNINKTNYHFPPKTVEHKKRPNSHISLEIQVMGFVDIGGIVDHHCLEVVVCFVDIGGIVDHHCLEVVVCFFDIGGIVDHHCLEVVVCFVEIGGIVDRFFPFLFFYYFTKFM
jgi:hypothetical protein